MNFFSRNLTLKHWEEAFLDYLSKCLPYSLGMQKRETLVYLVKQITRYEKEKYYGTATSFQLSALNFTHRFALPIVILVSHPWPKSVHSAASRISGMLFSIFLRYSCWNYLFSSCSCWELKFCYYRTMANAIAI